MSQTPFSDVKPVSYEEFMAGATKGDKLMSKPSQELLRRAREWLHKQNLAEWNQAKDAEGLARFAEQIVRECAEIAVHEPRAWRAGAPDPQHRIEKAILRKFQMEKE